jgi:hypothetical protein
MIVETIKPEAKGQRFQLRCVAMTDCPGPVFPEAETIEEARRNAQLHADKWRHAVEIDDTGVDDRRDAEPAPPAPAVVAAPTDEECPF